MKLPQPAPDWKEILKKHSLLEIELSRNPDFIRKCDERYPYWDEFKQWNMPDGGNPEKHWALTKFWRAEKRRYLPLEDTKGGVFSYCMTDMVSEQVHHIDRDVPNKILTTESVTDEEKKRYQYSSLMEEAIASSMIEGAAVTRVQAKEMLRTGRKPLNKSERMILNNYRTMTHLKEWKNAELNLDMLMNMQFMLTEDAVETNVPDAPGRLRRVGERVFVVDDRDHTELYVPPPAEKLSERLAKMFSFANNSGEFIHPVVKAIILHFWLAYEHPFADGNGRTARALFHWYLLKNNYSIFEFLSVSRIIELSPAKYRRSFLYSEYDENDLTYFLMYNMRAIRAALNEARLYVQRKKKESVEVGSVLKNYPGINERQYYLLAQALKNPQSGFTIQGHQKESGVVYQTARTDLLDLAEKGLLEKAIKGKQYFFMPVDGLTEKISRKV